MTAAATPTAVFALVTGGGTGGHVYPALAVAEALVDRGHDPAAIRFVGGRRGLEVTAVPAAGFRLDALPGRGLRRRLDVAAWRDNAGALVGTGRALGQAWRLVRRTRPRVVLGVGGYASLPCVVSARLAGVPTVVHEQNAAPGLTNRLAVRLGAHPAVSLPCTPLRGAVLTGNPVRRAITVVQRTPDPTRPLVLVFGGSLGARRLNEAALGLYDRWRDRADVAVCHVSGRRDHADCARDLAALRRAGDRLAYELVEYEEHLERRYGQAAVAVCRAGAVTVAELTVTGLPAILVPLPGAPHDHQTANAAALAAAGAATLVPDRDADAARLAAELDALLGAPDRLEAMSRAARALARPDAAARVADLVEAVARA
ncbi:MAG TPA: UDP-N-acetylglucosamine--N-acetylmuramyl-(pentapeptide) pyrophosphoryl-undecaprenol N-acetylglucosamine transferase [Acidimicrobiia bacterium]|jgi:undecaprenyldiphospho-muramoylpentapeptide beta-N-acetylglucosaminyltransferase|nr:UDP-N-acetylglucosamine--N-acetylmuramyl-(pentapeptide) pyrophosphoryl-undecaprenol N-acetylglucosamine transferase [Acidimicrobiia bacterium]HEV3450727.1 UDP-N-acetylglucosamine--N-acetylmuramyl-(pentapeptide) pyrophosphoryl-undecaprenol N-acetylglucosamine transferase [Acidimicrobiia bacterium]